MMESIFAGELALLVNLLENSLAFVLANPVLSRERLPLFYGRANSFPKFPGILV